MKNSVKEAARQTLDLLPDDTTWDDVIYRMYVRQKIEAGLADSDKGNLMPTGEARRLLGLSDAG